MNKFLLHSVVSMLLFGLLPSGKASFVPGRGLDREGAPPDSALLAGLHSATLFSILDLQFKKADSLLGVSSGLFPEAPGNLYLSNYKEFLDALIEGDRESFDAYMGESGRRIETLRERTKSFPAGFSYLSTIHLQSSILCAYQGEVLRSARHFHHSYRYLRQGEERNAGNPLNYRNRGLITLISGSVPEEFGWLLRVLGIRGEMEEGFGYLQEFHTAASGAELLEACLLLKVTGLAAGAGKEDLYGGTGDCGGNPHAGTLSRYVGALEELGSGRSEGVVELLQDYGQAQGERTFPYLDLLLGEAMLNRLDSGARAYLEGFVLNYRGEHYRHYAWHKLSWHYALNGQWDRYEDARQQVLHCGEPYLDADRQALREALDTIPPNRVLLKARLLFDGGLYQEALLQMNGLEDHAGQVPLPNHRDSLEYRYRLARIHERLGNMDVAVRNYQQVLDSDPGSDWYFAPNAALHLGMIQESSGNTGTAIEYYRECIRINRSAYRKSIDYKARQGIHRLEKLQKLK